MDLMIDIETLDVKPTGVIVSVGICAFDMEGIHAKQYFILDGEEQVTKGRTISFDTIEWWFRQNEAVHKAAFNLTTRGSVKEFLEGFAYFCTLHNVNKVWAQGTDFDLSMIADLHRDYDYELPYQFFLARDSRTMIDYMSSDRPTRGGDHHNAMDDAVYQAECVILALKEKG